MTDNQRATYTHNSPENAMIVGFNKYKIIMIQKSEEGKQLHLSVRLVASCNYS